MRRVLTWGDSPRSAVTAFGKSSSFMSDDRG